MSGLFKLKRISDGEEFSVGEISLLVGRSDSCDIIVEEGHPSREHARIAVRDGLVLVQDLHSTNGTYVNNQKIEASAVLKIGDVVKFGDEAFSVQSHDAPEATVMMRALDSNVNASAMVIDDDEDDDEDSTSIMQAYSLPPGWFEGDNGTAAEVGKLDERKRAAIDRYLQKFNESLKGRAGIFLVLFSENNPPVIKSLVLNGTKVLWTFGRDEQCDIVFDHVSVSKHHADISHSGDGWLMEDSNSTNGITVQGIKKQKVQLRDDMALEIGLVNVMVRYIR